MHTHSSMKSIAKLVTAAAVASAAISAPAIADDKGFYGTLSIGGGDFSSLKVGTATVDFDPGFNFEGGIGYDFGNNWRAEFTYDRTTSEGWSVFNTSIADSTLVEHLLASAYYDFNKSDKKLSPFIGVSAGNAWVSNGGETATAFAYGISAGANYEINEDTTLFGKLTHIRATQLNYSTVYITNASDTSLKAGLRYKF